MHGCTAQPCRQSSGVFGWQMDGSPGGARPLQRRLWGWLAHIPGLTVLVPSSPADAGGLMTAALQHDGPVIFLESKLLSESWLEFLGSGGRRTVQYDIPAEGAR